jgi:hypothetical protein
MHRTCEVEERLEGLIRVESVRGSFVRSFLGLMRIVSQSHNAGSREHETPQEVNRSARPSEGKDIGQQADCCAFRCLRRTSCGVGPDAMGHSG